MAVSGAGLAGGLGDLGKLTELRHRIMFVLGAILVLQRFETDRRHADHVDADLRGAQALAHGQTTHE